MALASLIAAERPRHGLGRRSVESAQPENHLMPPLMSSSVDNSEYKEPDVVLLMHEPHAKKMTKMTHLAELELWR